MRIFGASPESLALMCAFLALVIDKAPAEALRRQLQHIAQLPRQQRHVAVKGVDFQLKDGKK